MGRTNEMNRLRYIPRIPILAIGYDWERYDRYMDSSLPLNLKTSVGLSIVAEIHERHGAPFTVFVLGSSLSNDKALAACAWSFGGFVVLSLKNAIYTRPFFIILLVLFKSVTNFTF